MPWCEDCARFYNPNTLSTEGDCPEGHHVADPAEPGEEQAPPKAPWHFWLLVIALALYLGWRLIQLIGWLVS